MAMSSLSVSALRISLSLIFLAPISICSYAQTAHSPKNSTDEQSCRIFVQKFYDWYWNRFTDRAESLDFNQRSLPTDNDVLKRDPPVLDSELLKLLKKEEADMIATQEIGNLDFDPFLNTQDPQGKYLVSNVTIAGGHCKAAISRGREVMELRKSGSSWLIVNLHYSFYSEDGKKKQFPDSDLIQILTR
jgi:hypothetical protein